MGGLSSGRCDNRYAAATIQEIEEFRVRMDLPRHAREPRPFHPTTLMGRTITSRSDLPGEPTIQYDIPSNIAHSLPPSPMRDDPRSGKWPELGPFILFDGSDEDDEIRHTLIAFWHLWRNQGKSRRHTDRTTHRRRIRSGLAR